MQPVPRGPYQIILPLTQLHQFWAARRQLRANPIQVHLVTTGESLSGVADDYGSTIADLKQFNQLKSVLIHVGDTIRIPPLSLNHGNRLTDELRNSRLAIKPAYRHGSFIWQHHKPKPAQTYQVKSGDTLSTIALAFHVSQAQLKKGQ